MNRRNWLSALLAVMMVISMMACIAMPAVAETTGQVDVSAYPRVSEVDASTLTANVSNGVEDCYRIDDWEDLLYANANGTRFGANSETTEANRDTVYLNFDPDISEFPYDAATYASAKEAFAASYAFGKFYGNFDGNGHTISNFYDVNGLFNVLEGSLRNLTIENAEVNAGNTNNGHLIATYTQYGMVIDNVHIKNSVIKTDSENYAGIFFGYFNPNGGSKDVYLTNCSAVNTDVICANTGAVNNTGLICGRMQSRDLIMENLLLVDCEMQFAGSISSGNNYAGLLFDRMDRDTDPYKVNNDIRWNNIGIFNCGLKASNAVNVSDIALFGKVNYIADTTPMIDNIFAFGNYKTDGTTNEPFYAFFADTSGAIPSGTLSATSNIVTDNIDAITMTVAGTEDSDTDLMVAAENKKTGLSVGDVLTMLNANLKPEESKWILGENSEITLVEPYTMTFAFQNGTTMVLYADINGNVTPTAEEKAILSNEDWTNEGGGEVTLDYDHLFIQEDVIYEMVPHVFTYEGNGDQTHNKLCDKCDEHDEYNLPCTPVLNPEGDVASGYFHKSETGYKCQYCDNTWTVVDADSVSEAPYTLSFNKDDYYNSGSEVQVILAAKEDVNANALTATVTFSVANLEYKGYTPAEGYLVTVNSVNAENGTLVVGLTKADGTALTAEDTAVLKFTIKGIDEANQIADIAVSAELKTLVIDEGDTSVKKVPENKFASDEANVMYLVVGDFIAGDINSDGNVTLLDAILLIQKMNGTIHPNQDGLNFGVMAADVNGDGYADTGDVVLLMRHATRISVELTKATDIPIISYVNA